MSLTAEISSQRYFYFCLFNWFQDTYFFNCIIYFHSDRWILPSSFSFIFLLDISCLLIEIARLHGRYNIQNIYLYLSQPLMKYIFMFSDYSFSFSFFFTIHHSLIFLPDISCLSLAIERHHVSSNLKSFLRYLFHKTFIVIVQ